MIFISPSRLYENQLKKAESTNEFGKVETFSNTLAEAYIRLATFCDEQYNLIVNYMNSKDFEDKQAILEEMSHDHKLRSDERVKGTTTVILERNSNLDKQELTAKLEEKNNYLCLALKNYAKALCQSFEKYDLKIYRLISLWFANQSNNKVDQILGQVRH